ncbi:hypothetical protein P4S68_14655 [Pseudoalteromonas sp. Hal099]
MRTGLVRYASPFGETPNAFNPDYISGGSAVAQPLPQPLVL